MSDPVNASQAEINMTRPTETKKPYRTSKNVLALFLIAFVTGCTLENKSKQENKTEFSQNLQDTPDHYHCAGSTDPSRTLRTISIVPQFSASRIQTDYWPILTEIGKRTNICFQLEQKESIPAFEKALRAGQFDYAYMNPYHQVMTHKLYKPIVRDKKRLLTGIIVANKRSKLSSIKKLNGRTLLLPAPNAFAASLLTRSYLHNKNISFKPRYVKTHQNVYRGVAREPEHIGGGVNNTFNRESKELRSSLSVIFRTKGYPAHPFSALASLRHKEITNVQTVWLQIAEEPRLEKLFQQIQIKIPMKANYQQDYAQLKELGLENYVQ